MRIAVGGIHIECSTYNPVPTRMEDFRVLRGEALPQVPYFAFLSDYPAQFIPTLHARAIPGGPVTAETYCALRDEFLDRLRVAGPLDGVYLSMHGAMYVQGMEDAEGDWICATRAVVGDDVPISVSYDLHGNVTQRIIDAIDMFSTYRTAPHIDVEETMRRAVTMLVRCLTQGIRPHVVWAPVPVVLPGEKTSTEDEPARSLYGRLPDVDRREGVWDASLMVGYVWADEPRVTAASVMTGTDAAALHAAAVEMAAAYWEARTQFRFGCWTGSIEHTLERALQATGRPVIVADSGDNPTGGGVGDRIDVLRALIEHGARDVIVAGIADPQATRAACAAGVGARVTLPVGGALDAADTTPISVTGEVRFILDDPQERERQAVIDVGGIHVVVAARRRPYHNIADFTVLGLDPHRARIVVVKSGYLSPQLAPIASPALMALSPGAVDQHVTRLTRVHKVRPTFPFDTAFTWSPRVYPSARKGR
ncbi:MlrC domain protein [Komagataeibacter intermedius AF2]|uniref:Microcystinase C n=1 Tax=Komagataeibacter intermedius AF2 TaxID=1458464 RepID=A0A0N1N489_9PROT|nr:M81 family metallopeptidase [Komagataeibacter intermedius]KPH87877.1 MlrC domain protein [Komagataeibacter intermedius AF2]